MMGFLNGGQLAIEGRANGEIPPTHLSLKPTTADKDKSSVDFTAPDTRPDNS